MAEEVATTMDYLLVAIIVVLVAVIITQRNTLRVRLMIIDNKNNLISMQTTALEAANAKNRGYADIIDDQRTQIAIYRKWADDAAEVINEG